MHNAICRGLAAASIALSMVVPVGAATPVELAQFQARAQKAYFAEDAATLRSLAESTKALGASPATTDAYTYSYIQFRNAQVAILGGRKDDAAKAAEACIDALGKAVERDPKSAEALALMSACHGYLTSLGGLKAIANGPRSRKRIDAALALAPGNPRVIFVDGLNYFFAPSAFGGDKKLAFERFQAAARAFDSMAGRAGVPDWGAAETWVFVGRGQLEAGDAAAAAASFRKALAIAPDFAAARRRLAALGPR